MRRATSLVLMGWAFMWGCSLHKAAPVDAGPPDVQVTASATAEEPASPLPELEGGPPVHGAHPSFPVRPHADPRGACAGNLVPVRVAGAAAPECVLECASDAACPEGTICDAKGELEEGGKLGKTVSYCAVGKRPPGKPDAGAHAPPPAAPAALPKHLDVRKGPNGACPAGYLACGAACRLSCKSATECDVAGARCVAGMCEGPGAQPCK